MNIDIYYWLLIGTHIILGTACAIHALLYKRDSVAAFGWIAVSLGYPIFGPLFYYLFGINRTNRQARRQYSILVQDYPEVERPRTQKNNLHATVIEKSFLGLAHLGHELSKRCIVPENQIQILHNGEEAYPVMLEAIHQAKHYILLTTYIFETNTIGKQFIEALIQAHHRGVQVNVIIDGLGEWYSWPHASSLLKKAGVPIAKFDPPTLFPLNISLNLRNHRKLLLVDGQCAFAGGMNVGGRHLVADANNRFPVIDIQFQLVGPIVKQCEDIFCEDWHFITHHALTLPEQSIPLSHTNALCRAIEDGPNEYLGNLSTILVNAVAIAQESIWIMTPYFLPSVELTNALQAAALRGVKINILLPIKNNLPYVKWASTHILPRLLSFGVNIFYQPAPFVHSKFFIVDEYYSLFGSANIDPRSLRLNFELGIEVYNTEFATKLSEHCNTLLTQATPVTQLSLHSQSILKKIRNGICWLFSPYL